ncbi:MAG: hypothetical protein J7L12_00455 [Desulfurococcales archaeon]|nr:hypothetical protein [Desulfurococcales archaeon]
MVAQEDLKSLKKLPITSSIITLVMGIIIIIMGVTAFAGFIYSEIMYVIVGLMLVIFSALTAVGVSRANTKVKAGEACITFGWWIFSAGVGGIIVYVAPFFSQGASTIGVVAAVASAISIIFGLLIIIHARTKLGVPLTV